MNIQYTDRQSNGIHTYTSGKMSRALSIQVFSQHMWVVFSFFLSDMYHKIWRGLFADLENEGRGLMEGDSKSQKELCHLGYLALSTFGVRFSA